MADDAADQVLRFDADSDLERGGADFVDRRFQRDQVADKDGLEKAHAVNPSGYHRSAHVPDRGDASGSVDQLHDRAAVHVSLRIRVAGQHELAHEDLGVAHVANRTI